MIIFFFLYSFLGFGFGRERFAGTGKRRKKEIWVLGLEEKGHGWFGRERFLGLEEKTFAATGKRRKEEKKNFSFNAVYLDY